MLTPIVGIVGKHLATFRDFPVRQVGLSADVGKTIEGIQSQILKLQQAELDRSTATHGDLALVDKLVSTAIGHVAVLGVR